ncbi:MAG: exonuclease subunit SbcD, partial [Chloroflexota bacterium]
MPRILHAADLHLGMENYGRLDPATGLSSRVADFLAALDETVEYALSNAIDLYLFCGDAYKTRDPSPTYQRELARRIHRLASSGVAVFLLVGNHDLPNAVGRATTVEIFNTLSVPNVYVGRQPGLHRVETRRGVVQVVALPWMLRGTLLTRDQYRNRTVDELNEILLDRLREILQQLESELNPALPAILAGHAMVTGGTLGSERSIMLGKDVALPPSMLARPIFDYVAMGHLHRHQVLPTRPPIVYAGSLQRIDFGEEKEEKGFVVAEIPRRFPHSGVPEGETSFTFVPVRARRFLTIEVNADVADPTQAVLESIASHDIAGSVVRLVIRLSAHNEHLLKEGEIRRALRPAYYVAAVAKQVAQEARSRLTSHTAEELSPLETLE